MKKFNTISVAIAFIFSISIASCGAQSNDSTEATTDTAKVEGKCGEGKCGENKCGGDKKTETDTLSHDHDHNHSH